MDSRYDKLFGTSEITLLYRNVVNQGCKNNKIQRKFWLWDRKKYFVITRVCYISVLYNESPLYLEIKFLRTDCQFDGSCDRQRFIVCMMLSVITYLHNPSDCYFWYDHAIHSYYIVKTIHVQLIIARRCSSLMSPL